MQKKRRGYAKKQENDQGFRCLWVFCCNIDNNYSPEDFPYHVADPAVPSRQIVTKKYHPSLGCSPPVDAWEPLNQRLLNGTYPRPPQQQHEQPVIGNASLFKKCLFTIFAPIKPPLPTSKVMDFLLHFY